MLFFYISTILLSNYNYKCIILLYIYQAKHIVFLCR
nr:MAG TPA: hypothetical protein [Caudoviricetes sp.]